MHVREFDAEVEEDLIEMIGSFRVELRRPRDGDREPDLDSAR